VTHTSLLCPRPRQALLLAFLPLAGCAARTVGPPPPATDRVITPPAGVTTHDPAGLAHVARGLELLAEGHPAAAVTELKLALIYDPGSAYLHERLAGALLGTGDLAGARAALDEGLERAPGDPGLHLAVGSLDSAARRFPEAIVHLAKAAASDELLPRAAPVYLDALLWTGDKRADAIAGELAARGAGSSELAMGLAAALADHGRVETALMLYAQVRRLKPSDGEAALAQARLLSYAGRYGEAADALVALVQYLPGEAGLTVEIARLLRRAGRPEARAYHDEAVRLSAGDAAARLRLAAADLSVGAREDGLQLLVDAVRTWPDSLEAKVFLGEAMLFEDQPARCLELLSRIQAGPAPLHRLAAECLAATGEIAGAAAVLEGAVRAGSRREELATAAALLGRYAPDEETAVKLLQDLVARVQDLLQPQDVTVAEATLLDSFGRPEALEVLERLKPEESHDMDLVLRWTDLASRRGGLERAITTLERLLERDDDNPVLLNALGFTLVEAGQRLDEAGVWLQRARRLAPDQGFITDSLAWWMYKKHDFANAVRLLRDADGLSPGDPELLRHLGDALEATGKPEEARRCFQRALSRHPSAVLREQLEKRLAGSVT
jgi:tetratricopeptide (TPR) repeat protein